MDDGILKINSQISIPQSELGFRFSRSGGPGGQHAQKSATRVELLFDVANSPSLSEAQRARVQKRLSSYVDSAGVLHLVSQSERSQYRNRQEVVERFADLMRRALRRRKRRKRTKPTAASRERRLRKKKRRSQIKKWRKDVRDW
ncbi:MAG: alternative ribosome rescue aminoacyl-tRNA hydrolase ArfB [Anaerolineae bacterium]|jgi:ribosome-associated protein